MAPTVGPILGDGGKVVERHADALVPEVATGIEVDDVWLVRR